MTLRRIHIIVALAAAIVCGCALASAGRAGADADERARRIKAGYVFIEGVTAMNDSRYDDALILLDRAAALDPTDIDIAAVRAELIMATGIHGDSAAMADAYAAIRSRFLARPSDTDGGERFASLAARLYRHGDVHMAYRLMAEKHPQRTDIAMSRAWSLVQAAGRGDTAALDTALAIYDRLEEGLGPDPVIIQNRIRALAQRRDTAAMIAQLARYQATAPDDARTSLITGSTFYALGMPDSAIHYIDRACELDSGMGEAMLARADFYLERGDSARYDAEVFRALESEGLDAGPKLGLLTEYVRKLYTDPGHTARISRMFDIMERLHPGEAELHDLYGSYLATIDSAAAAAEQFGYAADLDPDEPRHRQFQMQTALAAADTIQAIDAGRAAMRLFPDNLYFPLATSSLVMMHSGPAAAVALLDSVDLDGFTNDHALSQYYTTRGDFLYKLGAVDSAFAQYEIAMRYEPDNAGAQNNAAYFMAVEGVDLPRARTLIERALRAEPLNPTYIDTYAWVLYREGDYPAARRQIDAVLSMVTDSTDITPPGAAASTPASGNGEDAEAVEVVEAVDEDFLPSAEVYDHAGDIYYMTGEPERAADLWRRALDLNPDADRAAAIRRKLRGTPPSP